MGKPKIRYMGNGVWACISPFECVAFGRTPTKAYARWLFGAQSQALNAAAALGWA